MAALKTPRHHQLYLILRQRILEGRYPEGAAIPGEHALAAEFVVARATLRKALGALAEDGLLHRMPGRGSFPQLPSSQLRTSRSKSRVVVESLALDSELLSIEEIVAPERVALDLGLTAGEKVLRILRLCRREQRFFCLVFLYLPLPVATAIDQQKIEGVPVIFHLADVGLKPSFARQSITARLAEPAILPFMPVPEGGAVLVYHNIVMDTEKQPLALQESLFDPASHEYLINHDLQLGNDLPHWQALG